MTSFLVKILLLTLVLAWTGHKILKWVASRVGGRYGKLAAELQRLLEEYGRGIAHSFRWMLVTICVLLAVRMVVIRWQESKKAQAPVPIEESGSRPEPRPVLGK